MAWWNFKREKRDAINTGLTLDQILNSFVDPESITKEQAMMIPSVAACVNLISDTVASLPIKLYKMDEDEQTTVEVKDDPRVGLLNVDTGDLLSPFQMKKQLTEDMLMRGGGYLYVNRQRNIVKSLNYVDNQQVGIVLVDPNPIFKKLEFVVYGQTYKEFEFIKLTRKTKDGIQGNGVVAENNLILSVAYNQMVLERMLYATGGHRKGFLKSASRLSPEALQSLKNAFNNFYSNNGENIMLLNAGLEFQEANNSAVEMQVNANKVANDEAICKIFGVPSMLLGGKTASSGVEMVYDSWIKLSILPILKAFESALNRDLLLETEKTQFKFQFETTEILRADILKRFQAYQLGVESGILQVDEIRNMEGWKPLNFDFIRLGLQDVLYNPDTQEIYTPNTNRLAKMGEQVEGANGTGKTAPGQTPPEAKPAPVPMVESPKAQNKQTSPPEGGEKQNED